VTQKNYFSRPRWIVEGGGEGYSESVEGLEITKFRQLLQILNSAKQHWIAVADLSVDSTTQRHIPYARALTRTLAFAAARPQPGTA
jgi:hypothetical protein